MLVLFNKLISHLDSREKMLTTFFSMSRSCCTLSNSRLRRRFSRLEGGLVPTAWERLFAMLGQFLAPPMNRAIGNAQLAGHLCNRLPARLHKLDCLLFEFSCVDFLNLCHGDPFPDLLEYISALGTLPNRGKVTKYSNASIKQRIIVAVSQRLTKVTKRMRE